jgi:hypothetical protein
VWCGVYDEAGDVIQRHEHAGEACLVAISQRVCVSTVYVRSDLSQRQRAGGSVTTTENVNIVADEADRAGSAAMAVSAFALEFNAN